jgi:hypothetical protein
MDASLELALIGGPFWPPAAHTGSAGALAGQTGNAAGLLQAARVRVRCNFIQARGRHSFDELASIDHRYPGRHVPRGREVVRDKQRRKPDPLLQVLNQVEYLSLNRYVQRADWLIKSDQARDRDQRSRYCDALALSARQ